MFGFFKRKITRPDGSAPQAPRPTAAPEPVSPAAAPPAVSEETLLDEVGKKIKEAFRAGDREEITRMLKQAYEAHRESEAVAGWVAGVIGEKGVTPLFGLMQDFVNRFPESLYSVRVQLADFMASRGDFDEASMHARLYLRLAADAGKLKELGNLRIIKDGVSRAFAILIVPYAILGAKSYAKRTLRFASRLDLDASWKEEFADQIRRLDAELSDPAIRELDGKWEAFFSSGSHTGELFRLCGEKGFPHMADRVDLIEGKFRFQRGYKVDPTELLLLVAEIEASDGNKGKGLV